MGGQLDEQLTSLIARLRVCLYYLHFIVLCSMHGDRLIVHPWGLHDVVAHVIVVTYEVSL